jgi:hypothetical protein
MNTYAESFKTFKKGEMEKVGKNIIVTYEEKGKFIVAVFGPKSAKTIYHYAYSKIQTRNEFIERIKANIGTRKKEKDQRRAEFAQSMKENAIKPGDVFYDSWGYDQTNIDFYKVVQVSAQTVIARKCAKVVKTSHGYCDYVEPGNEFVSEGIKCRIVSGYKGLALSLTNFGFEDHKAAKWEGKALYETASGWGH